MTRRDLIRSALAIGAAPADDFAERIFKRVNQLRGELGIPELVWSEAVAACAREQSARIDLLRFRGHDDPERGGISDRLNRAGIRWWDCAENLFREKGYDDPVHFAVVCWWYSPGHKANLVNALYTETGVGVIRGADGTFIVTQIFMRPRKSV